MTSPDSFYIRGKKPEDMYSSEDLDRFYLDYQSEWVPRGITLQVDCSRKNAPFKVMDKFVKDIRKRIYEVKMEGCLEGIFESAQVLCWYSCDIFLRD